MPATRHLGKVLAHAERELTAAESLRPTESLAIYKKFLRIEEHRLRLRHQYGGGGREICGLRVALLDVLLGHIFATATAFANRARVGSPSPLTVFAILFFCGWFMYS
ncbi:MAG: hypothetical protein ACJ8M4_08700, partial [Chthoniobacterales bacterium]